MRGVLVAANNRPHSWTDARYFGTQWARPFRAMRIAELLATGQTLKPADMSRLQLDLRDLHALRLRELIAKTAEAQGLEHEDGSTAPDSKEAAFYFVWSRNLTQEIVGHVASDRSSPVDRSPD